jgi:DNA-binding XRE family transcriptional regulator
MREHTRKHRIEVKEHHSQDDEGTVIWNDDAFKKWFGDESKGAVMLRGLRHREGLTQLELGKILGTAQANISLMEKGKKSIGKQIAKRLASVFRTDYRLFL